MRPIDADAAKNRAIAVIFGDESEEMITFARTLLDILLLALDDAPTIEAEPVRHGRWEINSDGYYPYCTNCRAEPPARIMTKYCPHCGAKMDGAP